MTFDTAAFAGLSLPNPDGDSCRLGDLWSDKLHLILFLRHFG
jgi:hypothetical protein